MKFNRERITALLALALLAMGVSRIVMGFASRPPGSRVPEVTLPASARTVVAKRYRTFTDEGEPARNPFSFSEGWQRMESAPMPPPPLPSPPRLLPAPALGPTALDAGFIWQDRPPPAAKAPGKEEEDT